MTNLNSICEMAGIHSGQEAWVFGKGPSLDRFDMNQAGSLRVCINEILFYIPGPRYFFAHDQIGVQRVTEEAWPADCIAVLEDHFARYAVERGLPSSSIRAYTKRQGDLGALNETPEQMASNRGLYGQSGTVHSALHFCYFVGVSKVTLVGFDGGNDYAKCYTHGVLDPNTPHHFDIIRRDTITMLERLGVPYVFFV